MPNISLKFTHNINRSAQPGDIVYYTPTTFQGGTRQASADYSGMTKICLLYTSPSPRDRG